MSRKLPDSAAQQPEPAFPLEGGLLLVGVPSDHHAEISRVVASRGPNSLAINDNESENKATWNRKT